MYSQVVAVLSNLKPIFLNPNYLHIHHCQVSPLFLRAMSLHCSLGPCLGSVLFSSPKSNSLEMLELFICTKCPSHPHRYPLIISAMFLFIPNQLARSFDVNHSFHCMFLSTHKSPECSDDENLITSDARTLHHPPLLIIILGPRLSKIKDCKHPNAIAALPKCTLTS